MQESDDKEVFNSVILDMRQDRRGSDRILDSSYCSLCFIIHSITCIISFFARVLSTRGTLFQRCISLRPAYQRHKSRHRFFWNHGRHNEQDVQICLGTYVRISVDYVEPRHSPASASFLPIWIAHNGLPSCNRVVDCQFDYAACRLNLSRFDMKFELPCHHC